MSVGADSKPRVHITMRSQLGEDDDLKFLGVLIMNPSEYAVFKSRFHADAFTVAHAGD